MERASIAVSLGPTRTLPIGGTGYSDDPAEHLTLEEISMRVDENDVFFNSNLPALDFLKDPPKYTAWPLRKACFWSARQEPERSCCQRRS